MPPSSTNITEILRAWAGGDSDALGHLAPIVYSELRVIASRYMARERKDHTLQPSALVNEAFLRLMDGQTVDWQDRSHFFALAANIMRRILVNHAIARRASKRGSGAVRVTLDEFAAPGWDRDDTLLQLNAALEALQAFDARKAQIVELRFFAGLSVEESSALLKVSPQTVLRDWSIAKSWLAREMNR